MRGERGGGGDKERGEGEWEEGVEKHSDHKEGTRESRVRN